MISGAQYFTVRDHSKGLITDYKATEITTAGSPSLQNVRIYGLSIGTRPGYIKIGATISAGNVIRDLIWHKQPDPDDDVLIAVTNNKLYYLDSTDTWRQISFSTGQGFSGNTEVNHIGWRGLTFFTNGTDELGFLFIRKLNENIITTDTDFDVDTQFMNFIPTGGGKLTIGTDEIDYTGKSYNTTTGITTLTGVTNIGASHTSGDLCFFYIEPTTGLAFNPLYCSVWAEKLWVAGIKYPSTLFYSVTASAANPEKIYDFTNSGTGSELVGEEGEIRGLKTTKDTLYIFKNGGIYYVNSIDLTAAAPVPQIQPLNLGGGAVSQKSIQVVENSILFFTGRDIRIVGQEENFTEITANSLSANRIEEELALLDEDQTSATAYYNPNKREYELFVKSEGVASNDFSFTYDLDKQVFLKNINKAANVATMFGENAYFGSSLDSVVYHDNQGFSDEATALDSFYFTKEFDFGISDSQKIFREVYITGGISDITTLTVDVYIDGEFKRSFTIDVDDISALESGAIGFKTFGEETIGKSGSDDNLYLFRKKFSFRDKGFKIQLKFRSDGIGYRWEIRDYTFGFIVLDKKASFNSFAT